MVCFERNSFNIPEITFIWQHVRYRSQVSVGGQELPRTPWITHLAFVLVWSDNADSTPTYDSRAKATTAEDNELRPKWSLGVRYAPGASGCRIVFVKPNSAADKGGLRKGDMITSIGGVSVLNSGPRTDRIMQILKRVEQASAEIKYNRQRRIKISQLILDPKY